MTSTIPTDLTELTDALVARIDVLATADGPLGRGHGRDRARLRLHRRARDGRAGFKARAVLGGVRHLDTNLSLPDLSPARFRTCVLDGGTGYASEASVAFPDLAQARSVARRARADATLEGPR